MPKFVLILGGADLDKRSGSPAFEAILPKYEAWLRQIVESGRLQLCHKLRDQTGARLTVRAGQILDGPFVETKESIGGITIVEAPSLEDAIAIARECPALLDQNGFVEVRAVDK
jgi:hypothetical protein